MLIRSLTAWCGVDFSVAHGEVLDVPDEIGEARIAANLAELADTMPAEPETPAPARRARR